MGWPEGLHAVALYSGRPASTTAALKGGIDRQGEGVANIGAAARALIERWETGSVPAVLEALAQCERRFETLATFHPWLLPAEVRELKERITRAGATPRVSGAGGGDCVLAWSEDPEVLATLANENANVVVAQLPRELAKQEVS